MIRITCASCQKPLSLDETKLPMKEVSFPCPACKEKVTVDRRTLGAASGGPAPVEAEPEDHGEEFGTKAFIVGNDQPAVRHAAKLAGFLPVHFATAEQARDRFVQDVPPLVIIDPAQITPPPLEAMQPILGVSPADRRKSFFILFSENLRTFDGNAAFLYGVNLTVAHKDLGSFPQIYREATQFHERLYGPMKSILRHLHGGD